MAGYISSNQNRFYCAVESAYGQAQSISSSNRFPAMHMSAAQTIETARRLDKTGTRTYQGPAFTGRVNTGFEVRSYLSVWSGAGEPPYGPLFSAACGATATILNGVIVNTMINGTEIVSSTPHGLAVGAGISWMNEIRFVTTILNDYTFIFNAPFTNPIASGELLSPTVTYRLATTLPSVTLYDYWDSQVSISRLMPGCAVDVMELLVNGDYHEFVFSGPASDLVDAMTFVNGSAGLLLFPTEPTLTTFNGSGVPGHLGQVWIGANPSQFLTLTGAKIQLRNNLELRTAEFGRSRPASVTPGERVVKASFSLLVQDDSQTIALYAAAKARQPFAAMLQLGTQQGQLMGVYLPQVTSTVPSYNDGKVRLAWDFENNVAQGGNNDELFIAFA